MKRPYAGLLVALLGLATLAAAAPTGKGGSDEVALGARLYHEGIGADGRMVTAISQADVPLAGAQAACMNCHRPSGLGSSEGGYYVPPIHGPVLYAPRQLDRLRLYPEFFHQIQPDSFKARLHQPHMRPAYDPATLARVLRRGVDAAGQPLAPIMPRYRLSDRDVAALDAYLHTLSAHPDPGVGAGTIQLATVFSDNVPPAKRTAMQSTLEAYVAWHNQRLNGDQARQGFSVYGRSPFVAVLPRWSLAIWTLTGDPSTWRAQMEQHYRAGPVFAVVGGRVDGPWDGPGGFCEEQQLPCLFPDTELPTWPVRPFTHTAYFSAGLMLDARMLAVYAATHAKAGDEIVQLAADDVWGRAPAAEFTRVLQQQAGPAVTLRTIAFTTPEQLTDALHHRLGAARAIVLWPGSDAAAAVAALASTPPGATRILLPHRVIPVAAGAIHGALRERMRFADADELEPSRHARSFETWAWMRTRHLGQDHPRQRLKAYYVMTLLDAALAEINQDFYRDHLIERIEDESQKDINPGLYSRMALSPGERIEVKSGQVVALDAVTLDTIGSYQP